MDRLCQKYVQFEPGTEVQAMADVCVDLAELCSDRLGGGLVRQEMELTSDERQYLMSVERGDTPSVLQLLQEVKVSVFPQLIHRTAHRIFRLALQKFFFISFDYIRFLLVYLY